MPAAKVTKNVSAAIGGGNVLCSTLISIKTKAWLYSFHRMAGDNQVFSVTEKLLSHLCVSFTASSVSPVNISPCESGER